jgi:hypothetical protein
VLTGRAAILGGFYPPTSENCAYANFAEFLVHALR